MEASGNPPPPPPQTGTATPPPPPPPPASVDEKAGGGWRALGVLLALALAFACAVMIIAMLDISDTPQLADCRADPTCTEYFDGSSAQKVIAVVFGFASGGLAGIGALVSLFFVFTGRRGREVLLLTGAAIATGAVSLLIGNL